MLEAALVSPHDREALAGQNVDTTGNNRLRPVFPPRRFLDRAGYASSALQCRFV